MPKIKQLSQKEAQKIAAGQVIERPADIVKELIENSIDASATHISLYIKDGGKELIRVVDNGSGMDAEDAKFCFSKHATSKITTLNQLNTITTFGFRGEALSSIAAVSKIILITKTAETLEGTKIEIADSAFCSQDIVATSIGTDITIHDLFYNIPARQKFLKKKETEWRHIFNLFQAFCLSHPSIHFQLFSEDKLFLQCPGVNTPTLHEGIKNRCTQLFNHMTAQHMLTLDTGENIQISGTISNHQYTRYDRNDIFFFVNSRWVKDFKLSNALIKGYSNVLPHGKYPMAVIALTIDPNKVDVNVHPRKEEVAFEKPRIIEHAITQAVKYVLENNLSKQIKQPVYINSAQTIHIPQPTPTYTSFDFNAEFPEPNEWVQQTPNASAPIQQSSPKLHPGSIAKDKSFFAYQSSPSVPNMLKASKKTENIPISQSFTTEPNTHTILGQFNLTYILIEKKEGLFLVDQHAAHERVMYELFAKQFENIPTIQLMFPQLVQLSVDEISLLEPHIDFLAKNGIGVESFGEKQIKIQSTPVHLKNVSIEELIRQLIGWINEYKNLDETEFKRTVDKKLHAQMACKAAVKAGDKLSKEQMEQLLRELDNTESNLTCPHGRPTGFLLSMYDIEKKFKRKV